MSSMVTACLTTCLIGPLSCWRFGLDCSMWAIVGAKPQWPSPPCSVRAAGRAQPALAPEPTASWDREGAEARFREQDVLGLMGCWMLERREMLG